MNRWSISNLIQQRRCKRKFTNQAVSKDIINQVLLTAGHAASSKNSQPWQVAVVTGDTQQRLINAMCDQFDQGVFESPDYVYMTDPMPDVFKQRARDCGYSLYELKAFPEMIKKNDRRIFRKLHFF